MNNTITKIAAVAALSTVAVAGPAMAAGTLAYNMTFEKGYDTVLDAENGDWYGDIQKVRSGKAGNIESSGDGSKFHAIAIPDASYPTGPFTRFDGYATGSEFVPFSTSVDVYLDPAWTVGEGFEWDVAASGTDGAHQQDFVIHVQRTDSGFLVGASNNSNHPSGVINVPSKDTVSLEEGGWVTLTHDFTTTPVAGYEGDILAVETAVDGKSLGTSISPDRNPISEVAGNRYGWFTLITVDHVNTDNIQLKRS